MAVSPTTLQERSAIDLRLSLPGLPSLSVGLNRLRTGIADWTSFWRDRFAPFFYGQVLRDFVLEGGNSGASWAPLSPEYATWKASRFPNAGILVRSQALRSSLAGPDAPDAIFRPSGTSLEVGTSVPYARYHQTGTSRMPARPPLRMSMAFMTVVGGELQKWVETQWQEARSQFVADVAAGIDEGLA